MNKYHIAIVGWVQTVFGKIEYCFLSNSLSISGLLYDCQDFGTLGFGHRVVNDFGHKRLIIFKDFLIEFEIFIPKMDTSKAKTG